MTSASAAPADTSTPTARRLRPYDLVRYALALVLLTAAALKAHQLATAPTPDTHLLNHRWVLLGLVEAELLLGFWLASGWKARGSWWAALLGFAGFGCMALYKALSGKASWSCLGSVQLSPWSAIGR